MPEFPKIPSFGEVPGGPGSMTLQFHCEDLGSIPGWGTQIPPAVQCNQKKKKKFHLAKGYGHTLASEGDSV